MIAHYLIHARQLPWRARPGEGPPDPYRVWLSEIMLQQTTVAAVGPRFDRFVARWPTVADLAAASDADILGEWAGLGYYARARNLIACARHVAAGGGFPASEVQLRTLPGIGEYTAAAIAAIAFGRRAVVIDTNVARVIARLNGLEHPARGEIRALVDRMTPADGAGDFAQAMMDLGATICRPCAPDCPACPLNRECVARASSNPERFPAPPARRLRPQRHGIAWWIERDGAVWLVRRPPHGLLGGMAALPGGEWTDAPPLASPPALARVRHLFTHFALDLAVVSRNEPAGEGWWQPLSELDRAGLPTLYRLAADRVLAGARANAQRPPRALEEARSPA